MASAVKNEELASYRRVLDGLRARLRGDLSRMTDEALRRENNGGGGSHSSVPLHMADLGTENYDQEFTLGLIESEQGTLELINEALERMERGTYGQCAECREPIAKSRLQIVRLQFRVAALVISSHNGPKPSPQRKQGFCRRYEYGAANERAARIRRRHSASADRKSTRLNSSH